MAVVEVTREQRAWARVAGAMLLLNYVLQGIGDSVTIMARGGEGFAETARFASESAVLWRFALVQVGAAWIATGVLAFALYAVLEPAGRRIAQLGLVMRAGASFVGAASLMFRYAQARLYQASTPGGPFTTDQLRTLSAVSQRGANAGVTTAWIFMGMGSLCFYLLFLRARVLPGGLARIGIAASALLIAMSVTMFVFPERTGALKLLGVPTFLVEVVTAFRLLRGIGPRSAAGAPAS